MEIDQPLVSKLEKLARLKLSDEERSQLMKDLNAMLGMIDRLNELELDAVDPLEYVSSGRREPRADEVGETLSPAEALQNAPDQEFPYFRVPKVIQNKSRK